MAHIRLPRKEANQSSIKAARRLKPAIFCRFSINRAMCWLRQGLWLAIITMLSILSLTSNRLSSGSKDKAYRSKVLISMLIVPLIPKKLARFVSIINSYQIFQKTNVIASKLSQDQNACSIRMCIKDALQQNVPLLGLISFELCLYGMIAATFTSCLD